MVQGSGRLRVEERAGDLTRPFTLPSTNKQPRFSWAAFMLRPEQDNP
jgi:hypothetical protein